MLSIDRLPRTLVRRQPANRVLGAFHRTNYLFLIHAAETTLPALHHYRRHPGRHAPAHRIRRRQRHCSTGKPESSTPSSFCGSSRTSTPSPGCIAKTTPEPASSCSRSSNRSNESHAAPHRLVQPGADPHQPAPEIFRHGRLLFTSAGAVIRRSLLPLRRPACPPTTAPSLAPAKCCSPA